MQNDILRDSPKRTLAEIGLVAILVAAFAFLFYAENPVVLSSTFLLFLATNVLGWVYIQRVARPLSSAAADSYRVARDRVGKIKVMLYEKYMFGRWQWWRFAVGFTLLIALATTSLDLAPLPSAVPREVAFTLLTMLTLGILEVWIWYKRLELKIQWDGLDWLNERAFIPPPSDSPNTGVPGPAP